MVKIIIYMLLYVFGASDGSYNLNSLNYDDLSKIIGNSYVSQTISIIYKNKIKIGSDQDKCNVSIGSGNIYIDGSCEPYGLTAKIKNKIDENIYSVSDTMWSNIVGRSSGYNQNVTGFVYTGSRPIFDTGDKIDMSGVYNTGLLQGLYILSKYSDSKLVISISDIQNYIAVKYISWFVANRDIKLYSDCQKQNFDIAMKKLSSVKLSSGEKLNINKELSGLSGYCMGVEGSGKYMFYQGVCGTSTLFFRNSLVNPNIYITKRQGHSNRYTKYYGEYIYGDDAAIYEMDKQFEIKNDTNKDMYIKFWTSGDLYNDSNKYLVSISPGINDKIIKIKKEEINNGNIDANLGKYVYINSGQSLYIVNSKTQTRLSSYYNKIYDAN